MEKQDVISRGSSFVSYEVAYILTAIIMASAMTAVFFGMALNIEGYYYSDSPKHIICGTIFEGYGLETIFVYLMSRVFAYPLLQLIFALNETLLVMLTWMLSQKFIKEFFYLDRRIVLVISTGLVFLTSIYIPVFLPDFYKEGFGTQPWHNSTYYGMRFVGLQYILLLYRVLPKRLNGISLAEWWRLACSLAVATMFKPNFLLTVCTSLGLIFIVDSVRYRSLYGFKNMFVFVTTVIPAFIILMVQYVLTYMIGNTEGVSGIEIVWFSDLMWRGTADHMILVFVRQFAFTVIAIIVWCILSRKSNKVDKDINMIFSILMYVMSLAIFSIFKETGPRADHGNFGWGICMGFYSMYLYIVPFFVQQYNEYKEYGKYEHNGILSCCFGIGFVLLCMHVISGMWYFGIVASGTTYYL